MLFDLNGRNKKPKSEETSGETDTSGKYLVFIGFSLITISKEKILLKVYGELVVVRKSCCTTEYSRGGPVLSVGANFRKLTCEIETI